MMKPNREQIAMSALLEIAETKTANQETENSLIGEIREVARHALETVEAMVEDDFEPAFPCAAFGPAGDSYLQQGITVHDYYVGQALQGLCARLGMYPISEPHKLVTTARDLADRIVKLREGKS